MRNILGIEPPQITPIPPEALRQTIGSGAQPGIEIQRISRVEFRLIIPFSGPYWARIKYLNHPTWIPGWDGWSHWWEEPGYNNIINGVQFYSAEWEIKNLDSTFSLSVVVDIEPEPEVQTVKRSVVGPTPSTGGYAIATVIRSGEKLGSAQDVIGPL